MVEWAGTGLSGEATSGSAAVAAQLVEARDQLRFVLNRVEGAAQSAPRHDASGWVGLAAFAYQGSLDQLTRELAAVQELMRSAVDLANAAIFEVDAHG
jgi:hypothetical protein